jgi:two-component system, OmpR family, phosphate regulon sensor histidine kinase PhoR
MKRLPLNLDLTAVVVIIAAGVLLPVMLSTAVGIVALVIARDAGGIVTGVLVISFAVTAAGGALIAVVLTGKKARLARLQADFVANVSHELRTPLSAIKLYTQTLLSGRLNGDPAQTAHCLATIVRETEWLDVMLEQVLTWRAASRDMMTMDMETRPVARAVGDAVERFRAMVPSDEVDVASSIETRIPVRHDARALQAVVLNLLTNAYKYTGKVKRIRVRVRDDDGHVVIEVQDNGIGLSAQDMKRVFHPFYRAQRQDGSGPAGVGLGLPIAKHLVSRHRGSITVNSAEGQGSTFTIRLPRATELP